MAAIFDLQDVSYEYPDGRAGLRDIALSVAEGESLILLGANGSGKSTLLKLMDGLVFPSQGSFTAFGRLVTEEVLERGKFAEDFRRRVAFVFQDSDIQLFSSTVFEEIAFGPLQLDISNEMAVQRVEDTIEMFGLSDLRDHQPHQLSEGEKKKVAIASSLAIGPDVIILDEPGSNLDPRTKSWLIELLVELTQAKKTIILATQDLDMASELASRVILLNEDHRLVAEGEPAEILADTSLLITANLLHEHQHKHGRLLHRHPHPAEVPHEHGGGQDKSGVRSQKSEGDGGQDKSGVRSQKGKPKMHDGQ